MIPDPTTAPYLAIDITSQPCNSNPITASTCTGGALQLPNQIVSGQTLNPIYPVSWYIPSFAAVATQWSLVSDPWGSSAFTAHSVIASNADGSATITAGTGVVPSGRPLIVQAINGAYSATATFYTAGTSYLMNNHQ